MLKIATINIVFRFIALLTIAIVPFRAHCTPTKLLSPHLIHDQFGLYVHTILCLYVSCPCIICHMYASMLILILVWIHLLRFWFSPLSFSSLPFLMVLLKVFVRWCFPRPCRLCSFSRGVRVQAPSCSDPALCKAPWDNGWCFGAI